MLTDLSNTLTRDKPTVKCLAKRETREQKQINTILWILPKTIILFPKSFSADKKCFMQITSWQQDMSQSDPISTLISGIFCSHCRAGCPPEYLGCNKTVRRWVLGSFGRPETWQLCCNQWGSRIQTLADNRYNCRLLVSSCCSGKWDAGPFLPISNKSLFLGPIIMVAQFSPGRH